MVVETKKDGKLCIYLDLKDLNQAIQCEHQHYSLPTIEEILHLTYLEVFTILDVLHGFWYVPAG